MATKKEALTAELLAERIAVVEEASALESKARKLRSRQEQIDEIIEPVLIKAAKASIKRCGYLIAWVKGRAYVSWKDEFIRVAGVEEADRISRETPAKQKLQITPPPA